MYQINNLINVQSSSVYLLQLPLKLETKLYTKVWMKGNNFSEFYK